MANRKEAIEALERREIRAKIARKNRIRERREDFERVTYSPRLKKARILSDKKAKESLTFEVLRRRADLRYSE